MLNIMEKHTIITLMNQGKSLRETSRITGFSRKAVTRYWKDYLEQTEMIKEGGDILAIQERITNGPVYDTSSRKPKKYTDEIDAVLDSILAEEVEKCRLLGIAHKQHLTCRQIHAQILAKGHDIGLTTITMHISEKRARAREAFIRQEYDLGQRLEYDFGEVRLVIGGISNTYHIAAFASPAGGFRWGFIYTNQRKEAFLDSHVRFFKMIGGVYCEVVYDNMRNVVVRFIGRNDKELNPDLLKMAMYYGFSVNVTNCFAGNEKGYVESAVKWIRNKVFAARYAFDTLDEAREYLAQRLKELNERSRIDEERRHLMPARPPLQMADILECTVDKYSFIRVDNRFYSVPDHLVGHTLVVKAYPEEIVVFSAFTEICRHRRLVSDERYCVDIFHYLDTLARKPGAVKNSVALRSKMRLKEVFDERYADCPKDFIVELERLKDLPIDKIADALKTPRQRPDHDNDGLDASIRENTKSQLAAISAAFLKGGERLAC